MIYAGVLDSLASGYATAGLHHLCSLCAVGYNDIGIFSRYPIPWLTFPAWVEPLRRLPRNADRSLLLTHFTPDQLATTVPRDDTRYVGMTAPDADRIQRWAAIAINKAYPLLIVPSQHSAHAAEIGGIKIPVAVVPHPAHESLWLQLPKVNKKRDPYVFYYIGSWNERKNPQALIRAYVKAFPGLGPTRLVMKLTGPEGLVAMAHELVRTAARNNGQTVADDWTRPDIAISAGLQPEKSIRELHAYGDCYVSPHRGEAWGLAAFEAALLGRRVIYTDWSGVKDYLTDPVHIPVPYTMVGVQGMGGQIHYSHEQQWADPDQEALAAALQQAERERRVPDPTETAVLRESYGYQRCGKLLREALGV